MQITLTFNNDSKGEALLQFLKTLDFVAVSDKNPIDIPESQIKETQRRLQMIEKGEMKTRLWDEAQSDIFKM